MCFEFGDRLGTAGPSGYCKEMWKSHKPLNICIKMYKTTDDNIVRQYNMNFKKEGN